MKKPAVAAYLYFTVSFFAIGQSFELPPVTNNVESIKHAFQTLIENAENLGIVEYRSDWTSSPESITRHYINYLEDVLANMTYNKVNSYVAEIRMHIDRLDRQAISRNAELDHERYLTTAYKNYPAAGLLNNDDNSQVENLGNQIQKHEELLADYRSRLESLPMLNILQSQLDSIQDELKKPENRRNSQYLQKLKNDETRVINQIANNNSTRVTLTDNIKKINIYLQEAEKNKVMLIDNLEKQAREFYIKTVHDNIYNFYSWEAFFRGENTALHDFLVLLEVKQKLYNLLDEIPQREAEIYGIRIAVFCDEWKI
jgi:chromosome segregation ATPase